MTGRAIEIRVCFKNKLKNAFLTVAAGDVPEAKRIAKAWGEKEDGEPVTRTVFKREVPVPKEKAQIVDGIKVWPPLF
jgi:hypothetical protein